MNNCGRFWPLWKRTVVGSSLSPGRRHHTRAWMGRWEIGCGKGAEPSDSELVMVCWMDVSSMSAVLGRSGRSEKPGSSAMDANNSSQALMCSQFLYHQYWIQLGREFILDTIATSRTFPFVLSQCNDRSFGGIMRQCDCFGDRKEVIDASVLVIYHKNIGKWMTEHLLVKFQPISFDNILM